MVNNFFLRFFWLFGIHKWPYQHDEANVMNFLEIMAFINLFAEAIRRTIWSFIRVENEFFNNFENYRTIPQIPNMVGMIEKIDWHRIN